MKPQKNPQNQNWTLLSTEDFLKISVLKTSELSCFKHPLALT